MKKRYENPLVTIEKFEPLDCISISHTFSDDGLEIPIEDLLPGAQSEDLLPRGQNIDMF